MNPTDEEQLRNRVAELMLQVRENTGKLNALIDLVLTGEGEFTFATDMSNWRGWKLHNEKADDEK
jgi:uncharacterized protein YgiM (DUF1202 family)